jgi:hypothetical protein
MYVHQNIMTMSRRESTVTISELCVAYKRGLDWMIGFIDTFYIQLGTTRNYSAIADLHTFPIWWLLITDPMVIDKQNFVQD